MMNDDERRRAEEAMAILGGRVFSEAVESLDRGLVADWRSAKSVKEREALFIKQWLLGEIVGQIRRHIERAAAKEGLKREEGPFRAFLARMTKKKN